jgi:hypothetical protein
LTEPGPEPIVHVIVGFPGLVQALTWEVVIEFGVQVTVMGGIGPIGGITTVIGSVPDMVGVCTEVALIVTVVVAITDEGAL